MKHEEPKHSHHAPTPDDRSLPSRRETLKMALAAGAGIAAPNLILAAKGKGNGGGGGNGADDPLVNTSQCRDVIANTAVPRWVDELPRQQFLPAMSTGSLPAHFSSAVGDVRHGVAPEWFPDHPTHQPDWDRFPVKYYQVNMRPGRQQLLPSTMGLSTDFWGYAGRNADGTFRAPSAPGPMFRFRIGEPVLARFHNDLPEEMSVHMHGGHWPSHSDGHASFFVTPGNARDYYYPNIVPRVNGGNSGAFDFSESVSTMWYHDHAQDMTAPHVARGLSGMCPTLDDIELGLISSGVLPGIRGQSDVGPEYRNPYDIPIVIQDRLFSPNGNICYDNNDHNGYLGNVILCNAKAYPRLTVERRKYRFRILTGGNSRIFRFRLSDNSTFLRIAKDSWLFPKPQQVQAVMGGPAARSEIIIDFSKYRPGQQIYLENILDQTDPRGPGGDLPDANNPVVSGRPSFTHRVLRFDVVEKSANPDASINVNTTLRHHEPIRDEEIVMRRSFRFERKNGQWAINGQFFDEHVANATPTLGTAEEWTLENGGGGWWHPIHLHLESHQQVRDLRTGRPIPYQDSFKTDTTMLGPNSKIVMRMKFRTFIGPFVFHCHNVEHEDLEMMFQFDPRTVPTESPQPVQQFFS